MATCSILQNIVHHLHHIILAKTRTMGAAYISLFNARQARAVKKEG